jgi:hypothetical protein
MRGVRRGDEHAPHRRAPPGVAREPQRRAIARQREAQPALEIPHEHSAPAARAPRGHHLVVAQQVRRSGRRHALEMPLGELERQPTVGNDLVPVAPSRRPWSSSASPTRRRRRPRPRRRRRAAGHATATVPWPYAATPVAAHRASDADAPAARSSARPRPRADPRTPADAAHGRRRRRSSAPHSRSDPLTVGARQFEPPRRPRLESACAPSATSLPSVRSSLLGERSSSRPIRRLLWLSELGPVSSVAASGCGCWGAGSLRGCPGLSGCATWSCWSVT